MGIVAAQLESTHVEMMGDGVMEIGTAVLTLSNGPHATAKYVVQWKQEDGRWKWNTDIWNTSE